LDWLVLVGLGPSQFDVDGGGEGFVHGRNPISLLLGCQVIVWRLDSAGSLPTEGTLLHLTTPVKSFPKQSPEQGLS
jgi:hypothetical protein